MRLPPTQLMEKMKYSRPNEWSDLLTKLDTSVWRQVMDTTSDFFGIKDEEIDKRDVQLYRQKSYFARKDYKPPPRPDHVVVANRKRSASRLGMGVKGKPDAAAAAAAAARPPRARRCRARGSP